MTSGEKTFQMIRKTRNAAVRNWLSASAASKRTEPSADGSQNGCVTVTVVKRPLVRLTTFI
jgi:hypothetical protein